MPKHIDAPETAALVGRQLTEVEARVLARDLARVARGYGVATARVRKAKAQLRAAEADVRELRRTMRLLVSARLCGAAWAVAWVLMIALLAVGCAAAPGNRLVAYADADVLFTTPAEVDRLCQLAPGAPRDRRYLGCYFPKSRLAIVPHGDAAVLAHELRHAREGAFHP